MNDVTPAGMSVVRGQRTRSAGSETVLEERIVFAGPGLTAGLRSTNLRGLKLAGLRTSLLATCL